MLARELSIMKEAYAMLYTIENNLRIFIIVQMEAKYGTNWFHVAPRKVLKRPNKKNFENLNFHELESTFFRIYPDVFQKLTQTFYTYLQNCYPIRNKVAHNHILSVEELQSLTNSYEYIMSKIT